MNHLNRVNALWWSYNILSENRFEFPRALALVVTQLLDCGVIP